MVEVISLLSEDDDDNDSNGDENDDKTQDDDDDDYSYIVSWSNSPPPTTKNPAPPPHNNHHHHHQPPPSPARLAVAAAAAAAVVLQPLSAALAIDDNNDNNFDDDSYIESWSNTTTNPPAHRNNQHHHQSPPSSPLQWMSGAVSAVSSSSSAAAAAVNYNDDNGYSYEISQATQNTTPYSYNDFCSMWELVEIDLGLSTHDIENGTCVRGANSKLNGIDSTNQDKAQYGRILPAAMEKIFSDVLLLQSTDIFVDIGHGIGNTVLQAAYTYQCMSKGIELVMDRHAIAVAYSIKFDELVRNIHRARDNRYAPIGNIYLQHGALESIWYRDFLINHGSITKAFVNNFNNVFGYKSLKKGQIYDLDHYVAAIFASMDPGSIMVTMHQLLALPGSLHDKQRERTNNNLHHGNILASYYTMEVMELGPQNEVASWSEGNGCNKMVSIYKYTRVDQGTESAVFLCTNSCCKNAKQAIPIDAIIPFYNKASKADRMVLNECKCLYSTRPKRNCTK